MRKRHSLVVSLIVFCVVLCMVVVLDRVTKALAVDALSGGAVQPFIPGFLDFQLVYNTGAAWGMFEGQRVLFLIIAAVAVVAMLLYLVLARRHAVFTVLGLGLIAGGAIGNGIDRALSGKVVDFIHTLFIEFPFFNIADSAITVGTILFIIVLLFGMRAEPAADSAASTEPAAADPAPPPVGGGVPDAPPADASTTVPAPPPVGGGVLDAPLIASAPIAPAPTAPAPPANPAPPESSTDHAAP
jgi:signal peptidase II